MLKRSAVYYFIIGTLWIIAAIVDKIENPIYIGTVYWPSVVSGVLGLCFYIIAIVLKIKQRQER